MLSPQWLDELRSRITLSTLIGRTVRVQRAGREYKACCPFHDEKTPSFTINDAKGFYHCFGCGAHGDAIRWMTDNRGLPFMDAVKELAAEAGMDVPAPDPRAAKRAEQRASLHDVMAAAQDWFAAKLQSIEGSGAREYLDRRGMSADTQVTFGFGFAPDRRDGIANALKQFPREMLIEAGLLIAVDGKTPYDRFRGRLMIPIRDVRGRVIAFGGRILGDGEPKYLNSPETPLFDKGRTLYNLDRALPASRQSDRMVVVEGYMDAIALAQAGFEDAVAPLGTALTEAQIELLWKSVDRPVLCFDGDKAGQRAAMRAAERCLPVLRAGHSVDFLLLPDGKDPDDLVRDGGPAAFRSLLERKRSLADFLWETELRGIGDDPGPDQRAALLYRMEGHAKAIGDEIIRREYLRSFRDRFYRSVGRREPILKKLTNAIRVSFSNPADSLARTMQRAVLLGLTRYPQCLRDNYDAASRLFVEGSELIDWHEALLHWGMKFPDASEELMNELLADAHVYPATRDLSRDLAFSFFRRSDDPEKPHRDLVAVMSALNEYHETRQTVGAFDRQFAEDLTEDFFVRQQHARRNFLAAEQRVMEWREQMEG